MCLNLINFATFFLLNEVSDYFRPRGEISSNHLLEPVKEDIIRILYILFYTQKVYTIKNHRIIKNIFIFCVNKSLRKYLGSKPCHGFKKYILLKVHFRGGNCEKI